ncbi:F-box family protein [Rhynchospora pubera]|uniref:F-box family protein n=1 Tax=Rhynchospora pubera TaxID=906938 RepID=A0AAV8EBY3_9POAL|nr:F-box family protein [Rhynchospora pubera]
MMSSQESESDKMTNFPEELVVDIMGLSSMKTRAAVQMCMLSKRWNHLWPFLSALNFDLKEFNSGDPKQDKHSFSRFVTTMLNRRKAVNLDKFRLSCVNLWEKQYHSSIERWIIYAVQHQVKVLQLPAFSWCGSLVSKHIVACDNMTEKIYCPSLRKLFLLGEEDVVVLADKVGSISSLIHANVSLRDGSYGSSFLTYALNSLSCVENLDLCVHKLAASSQFPSIYPTLHKLKNLSICGHCFNYVLYMWKYMPNLEKITLWPYCQHYLWSSEGLNRDYALLREIMKCKKLKVLEVVCARFDDQERQLMDHFRKLKDPKIVISNKQFKN